MLGYIVEHALLIDVGASAGEVNRVGSTIYGTGMEADGLYLNIERVANRLNGVTGTVIIDAVEHLYLNVIAGGLSAWATRTFPRRAARATRITTIGKTMMRFMGPAPFLPRRKRVHVDLKKVEA